MSYKKDIATAILAATLTLTGCSGQTQYQVHQQPTAEVYQQQPTKTITYKTSTPNPPWDGTQQQCNAAGGKYIPDQNRCAITGPGVDIYQVRKGDTLWDIALRYGIDGWKKFLDEFILLNPNVDPDNLKDGQMILIPYKPYQ